MQKELTFYLVRHGRTIWNEQGLMQGSGNSDLTEEGIKINGESITRYSFCRCLFQLFTTNY